MSRRGAVIRKSTSPFAPSGQPYCRRRRTSRRRELTVQDEDDHWATNRLLLRTTRGAVRHHRDPFVRLQQLARRCRRQDRYRFAPAAAAQPSAQLSVRGREVGGDVETFDRGCVRAAPSRARVTVFVSGQASAVVEQGERTVAVEPRVVLPLEVGPGT